MQIHADPELCVPYRKNPEPWYNN